MIKRLLAKPLPQKQVDQLVNTEIIRIKSACNPSRIYLVGSAARGEMTDQSDLDFLVIFKDDAALKDGKKNYYQARVGDLWPVDVVFMTLSAYMEKSKIGGISMVCEKEGKLLLGDSDG